MRVEWYGQSAFALSTPKVSVAIDPFNDLAAALRGGGVRWEYPLITGLEAQLLLVTHEHADHNGVDAIAGDPVIVRSTAGRLPSPLGEITAIASEHDDQAGTVRGPNTIFVFELDDLKVCHLGDFGQRTLRQEQAAAIATVDLLFIPVGGGPTIGAAQASMIVTRLAPRWVVPMHYRTPRIGFLEPADAFLEQHASHVLRLPTAVFETAQLPVEDAPIVVVPAAP